MSPATLASVIFSVDPDVLPIIPRDHSRFESALTVPGQKVGNCGSDFREKTTPRRHAATKHSAVGAHLQTPRATLPVGVVEKK